MSSRRLQARTPSASFMTAAQLEGHALRFHKKSDRDGSGKCDILWTGENADRVHGVVFSIEAGEIVHLDRAEGLGAGYDKKEVHLLSGSGEVLRAFTYFATDIDPALSPLCWYKEHVMRGAEEHGLPLDYVAMIRAVSHVDDTDMTRRQRELSIYLDDKAF